MAILTRFLFGASVSIAILVLGVPSAYAHVGIGQYAGTHVVSLVPQPGSPFVGETVQMKFYLRDLAGYFANETFVVAVIIQEVLPDSDEESSVFATAPEAITDGTYETSYRFTKPGHYRVEFSFARPDEPEISREAIFDIDVRDVPRGVPYATALIVFVPGLILAFTGGFVFARRRSKTS